MIASGWVLSPKVGSASTAAAGTGRWTDSQPNDCCASVTGPSKLVLPPPTKGSGAPGFNGSSNARPTAVPTRSSLLGQCPEAAIHGDDKFEAMASNGLVVPPTASFKTWVYIMVVLTSEGEPSRLLEYCFRTENFFDSRVPYSLPPEQKSLVARSTRPKIFGSRLPRGITAAC